MKFLFVDEENAYEGRIAEAIAFDVMEDSGFDVETSSRGLNVTDGKKMSNFTMAILTAVDLEPDVDKIDSVQISQNDIDKADVVMTMTNDQKKRVADICPPEKLYTLLEYTTGEKSDIMSPKGHPMNVYRDCLCGIGEAFGTLLERWKNEKGIE
jgi:protein-tyrosine-phosphatase